MGIETVGLLLAAFVGGAMALRTFAAHAGVSDALVESCRAHHRSVERQLWRKLQREREDAQSSERHAHGAASVAPKLIEEIEG